MPFSTAAAPTIAIKSIASPPTQERESAPSVRGCPTQALLGWVFFHVQAPRICHLAQLANESLALTILLNRRTQRPAGPRAVPREHNRSSPKPRTHSNVRPKRRRTKPTVTRDKSSRRRHRKIRCIGNRLQRAELDRASQRAL